MFVLCVAAKAILHAVCWRMRNIPVQVLLPDIRRQRYHGPYRRKATTRSRGSIDRVESKSSVPIRAYILDSTDPSQIKAMVGVERGTHSHGIELLFSGLLDSPAIRSILCRLKAYSRAKLNHRDPMSPWCTNALLKVSQVSDNTQRSESIFQ